MKVSLFPLQLLVSAILIFVNVEDVAGAYIEAEAYINILWEGGCIDDSECHSVKGELGYCESGVCTCASEVCYFGEDDTSEICVPVADVGGTCQLQGDGGDDGVCNVGVYATTGNVGNGTSDADITITLKDDKDRITEHILTLNNTLQPATDCMESTPQYSAHSHFTTISVSRDDNSTDASWFSNLIKVDNKAGEFYFPIIRWVPAEGNLTLVEYDCTLPRDEIYKQQRREELARNREMYKYTQKGWTNGPNRVQNMPIAEKWTPQMHKSYFGYKKKVAMEGGRVIKTLMERKNKWKSLKDMEQQYTISELFPAPASLKTWNTDKWFGLQRVMGLNPKVIALCKKIPEKFPVTDDMVSAKLEGNSLSQALEKNKIFIIDLEVMEGIGRRVNQSLTEPIALFYLNENNDLMPIAIQLHQKPATDNPIFLPTDDQWTWTLAKMWFNNAESNYFLWYNHLGIIHMAMEGVCLAMHRNLSPSHPLFKLLSPHFLGLLVIDVIAESALLSHGSFFDLFYNIGRDGLRDLAVKGLDGFTIDEYGDLENNMKIRGVLDKDILPYYPYRDDIMPYYRVIKKYVTSIVNHYYDDDSVLRTDEEFVNFYKELTAPRGPTGMGIKWANGNKAVEGLTKQDLITLITTFITTSSVEHGNSLDPLYIQMSWIPNYSYMLRGSPPNDKRNRTEEDIVASLPNLKESVMGLTLKTFFQHQGNMNPLGDFEVQYMYRGLDVAAVDEFKEDLIKVANQVKAANDKRKYSYSYLTSVKNTRNSIST